MTIGERDLPLISAKCSTVEQRKYEVIIRRLSRGEVLSRRESMGREGAFQRVENEVEITKKGPRDT